MASVFTRIRNKEIEAQDILYEDDKVFVMLAKNPHTEGHSLVIPIEEIPRFEELPHEIFAHMAVITQKFAKVLEHLYHSDRVGVAIDGFQVDHTHVHVMPIWETRGGVWKGGETPEVSYEELRVVADKLRSVMPHYFD